MHFGKPRINPNDLDLMRSGDFIWVCCTFKDDNKQGSY